MSQPVYTSLDPLTVHDGKLDVGHGNFRASGDLGELTDPKWMAVVKIDGTVRRGQVPGMPSVPVGTVYPDELDYEQRLLFDLAPWKDGKEHVADVQVFAAQFYEGSGDHPDDAWEWGHYDATTGTTPAVLQHRFTLGTAPAPTPVRPWMPHVDRARAESDLALQVMAQEGVPLGTRRRQRAGMASAIYHADDATRKKAYAAIRTVFGWPP